MILNVTEEESMLVDRIICSLLKKRRRVMFQVIHVWPSARLVDCKHFCFNYFKSATRHLSL